jgi:hypothetical protein
MKETHQPSIERRLRKIVHSDTVLDVPLKQKIKTVLSNIPLVRPLHMLVKEPVVCLFALCKSAACPSRCFQFVCWLRHCRRRIQLCRSVLLLCLNTICIHGRLWLRYRSTGSCIRKFGCWVSLLWELILPGLLIDPTFLQNRYIVSAPTMIFPFRAQIRRQAKKPSSDDESGEALSIPLSPEQLLWPAMLGSLALPISFFWFGWSIQARIHWICPTFALGLFSWGNNLLYVMTQ